MVEFLRGYTIGVLRGGPSTEREISLLSGEAVLEALRNSNLEVKDIIVPEIKDISFLERWILEKFAQENIKICFIALHGWFGEDGLLQQILEKAGYLYTGSGAQASRRAMNKIESMNLFQKNSLPVPKFKIASIDSHSYEFQGLGFPLVIKPSSQGSSIGVVKVDKKDDFLSALQETLSYDGKAIIEEYIEGCELTVGILEDRPLPVIKIKSSMGLYNFRAKYTPGFTEYIILGGDSLVAKEAQKLALEAHKVLGCRSFSRVDMVYSFLKKRIYLLEVNTIPGLTKTSLLPKAARAEGIEFDQLILKMLKSAFQPVNV